MPVLMLQTFARQCSPARGAAHEKAFAARIGESPNKVPDALESEHRIIGKERNHWYAVIGVRSSRGSERRHRSGFVNAFFEDLAVLGFLVEQEILAVHRLVKLAPAGIDAILPE